MCEFKIAKRVQESLLYDNKNSILIELAEDLEAQAKALREQVSIVQ